MKLLADGTGTVFPQKKQKNNLLKLMKNDVRIFFLLILLFCAGLRQRNRVKS